MPSKCEAETCGDGVRTGSEKCDDGNDIDHDGCSSDCKVEPYFHCAGGLGTQTQCSCMRVRKDFTDLREAEAALYIDAVKTLKTSGTYDSFVQTHSYIPNKNFAHGSSGFLPWHRKLHTSLSMRTRSRMCVCG